MIALLLLAALSCGAERAPVKEAKDPAARLIRTDPVHTTVKILGKLAVPRFTPTAPRARVERQVYCVEATLTLGKLEADSDAHLVLQDGGASMIVEAVDPGCARGSRFHEEIAAVWRTLQQQARGDLTNARLHALGAKRLRVEACGVFFGDALHGQSGASPSGAELHPLLSLEVLP